MKALAKRYNLYLNLGFWFLGFIVLVFLGFYDTYFLVPFDSMPALIHVHFLLMTLWVLMLIVQPFLIKYRKLSVHRFVGKLSYLIVPLNIFVGFLMIRMQYYRTLTTLTNESNAGISKYTSAEVSRLSAISNALPFVYLLWLIVFYSLAVANRKHPVKHARYMLAAGLTVLGPTVDRIIFNMLRVSFFPWAIPIETFSFVLIDLVLAFLLWRDYREKRNKSVLWICLAIYLLVQLFYFAGTDNFVWETITRWIMKPAP